MESRRPRDPGVWGSAVGGEKETVASSQGSPGSTAHVRATALEPGLLPAIYHRVVHQGPGLLLPLLEVRI